MYYYNLLVYFMVYGMLLCRNIIRSMTVSISALSSGMSKLLSSMMIIILPKNLNNHRVYQILSTFCWNKSESKSGFIVCTPTLQGPRYGVYGQKLRRSVNAIKNVFNKNAQWLLSSKYNAPMEAIRSLLNRSRIRNPCWVVYGDHDLNLRYEDHCKSCSA